jgi:hypothetical protein
MGEGLFPTDASTYPVMFAFASADHLYVAYSDDTDATRCNSIMVYDFRMQAWGGPYTYDLALYCGCASQRAVLGSVPHFGCEGALLCETGAKADYNDESGTETLMRFSTIDGARPLMDKVYNEVRLGIDVAAGAPPASLVLALGYATFTLTAFGLSPLEGEGISLWLKTNGVNKPLLVTVTGHAIVVQLATSAIGVATSTVAQVYAAVRDAQSFAVAAFTGEGTTLMSGSPYALYLELPAYAKATVTLALVVDGVTADTHTYNLASESRQIRMRIPNARGKSAYIEVTSTGSADVEVYAVGADCFFVRTR